MVCIDGLYSLHLSSRCFGSTLNYLSDTSRYVPEDMLQPEIHWVQLTKIIWNILDFFVYVNYPIGP
ncbi:hypothetical protein XNC1_4472 [Xenorhabdus nematophila ATCC 19061]|uniref:Uncharacterized protein n=1 Tax=Xenorhabdus nematophila (strain ATCC 19061 / DSM 3370 / CCUG 14189 / LMG 1036 / NCIMB 9965 / AN6) TaxID=406817 RepID=D3VF37_XENNA|nr:hypothetical protein XNC1_4472 [Xenorhabdus nematophila ATCC 19061]